VPGKTVFSSPTCNGIFFVTTACGCLSFTIARNQTVQLEQGYTSKAAMRDMVTQE
jgi:hypothetical protein